MLSSTSAWEDMSCMTELKVVGGSVTKQSRDKALSPAPFHSPHLQIHTSAQSEHGVSLMAFPFF